MGDDTAQIQTPAQIIVVEDERIVALDLERGLQELGYHVNKVVATGEAAVAAAREQKPDLVLMDIRLQGEMNGIEAARMIHSNYDIPVVYLTAYADDQTLKEATTTGAYGYLVKPFEDRELKSTIEVALFKHKMEQELKESRARFQAIFEQNVDAIVLFKQSNFKVIDLNPAAVSLFQSNKDELIENFQSVFENQKMYRVFMREIIEFHGNRDSKELSFFDRCRLRKKDGSEIICSVQINVIKLQETNVLFCVFRDITEKIRIEEESRELQIKLMHANRMTSLGTLASGLAHEINNPNNFIMSNTQIIQHVWEDTVRILREYHEQKGDFSLGGLPFSQIDHVVPQLLKNTVEGARRIKHITDNLREFSRPKEARVDARISINKVLQFSITILNNQIKKFTDAFSFEPGEDIPFFEGNPQQIEQVIINLIQNALQALPDRTHGVRVSSFYDKSDQTAVVKVEDEGVGMNKKIMDRITDPFFTTKQDQGGTGLGLYISYSIIKAHKGVLEFRSLPGKGTTATIKLPVSVPKPTAPESIDPEGEEQ
ncbi:MAG: response regulator [Candidatus Aminicenantes bacterium]|nr:response regulator [Candidatus Aminicenantes bacterium]NIM85066.1 response regulator [Candidatus Aminicenantes bacterium]NIN24573.1 response regulator [Candidatus Aminicenantes bacterium]NIN48337.1 response regulator [Candidatus Aminicenantes bacterium]NIN91240.1 response regulator [Candidatus Aminicenantes bacterium]